MLVSGAPLLVLQRLRERLKKDRAYEMLLQRRGQVVCKGLELQKCPRGLGAAGAGEGGLGEMGAT